MLRKLEACPAKEGSCAANSTAISAMFWQNIAIHAVPSACSRWPPLGSGRAAVEDADVVESEKTAFKEVIYRIGLCGLPTN